METRANYVMVGSFVLVILAGIFVAILWLAHAQFNQKFVNYDIYFTGSVTGLSVGAPVNLNGVAIGKVIEIRLDPVNRDQYEKSRQQLQREQAGQSDQKR